MIYYFLLLVSILLTVCKSSLYNIYAKRATPTLCATFTFNAVSYGTAAAVALVLLLLGDRSLSLSTVLCAAAYAVTVFSLQTLSVTAMKVGAMSLTAISVMYGMIIPSLAGPIFWREPFGALQAAGILLMVASLWLLRGKGGTKSGRISPKWIPLAVLCFLLSGMAGVIEKIHQSTDCKDEKGTFVLLACLIMLVFSLAASAITYRKGKTGILPKQTALIGAASGAIIGAYSTVNLTLAGALASIVYYPVANGGAMLLTVLVSYLIFKEKPDRYRIIGTLIGLCGIVCLSIPV